MDQYADSRKDDVEIDIGSLFSVLWRDKGWIVLWTLVGLALAVLFLFMVEPLYKSDARLLIERRETVFTRPSDEQNLPAASDFDRLSVASQVQVLQSREILKTVADKLDLDQKPEFDPLAKPGNVISNAVSGLVNLLGSGGTSSANTREGRVIAALAEKLSVYSVGESRVVSVELVSEDPVLAADITNAIIDEFLAIQRKDSRGSAEEASRFLESEIGELRQKVSDAEQKVETFRASADLISVDDESTLTKQQLSETLTLLSDVSAQRTEAEAKANQIRRLINSGSALDSSSDVQSSPLIQSLREQQVGLRARIVDLQTTLLPNHPQVQAAQSQLNDLEQEIARQALLIARALEGDAEIAKTRQLELEQEIARLKTATARANEQEVKLRALEREAAAQREVLETYLTRFRESTARQNVELLPVNARIISRANVPIKTHFPKTIPTLAVAGFSGAFLASLFILAGTIMSGHAVHRRDGDQIQKDAPRVDPYLDAEMPHQLDEVGDARAKIGLFLKRRKIETDVQPKSQENSPSSEVESYVAEQPEVSVEMQDEGTEPPDKPTKVAGSTFDKRMSVPENLVQMVGEDEAGPIEPEQDDAQKTEAGVTKAAERASIEQRPTGEETSGSPRVHKTVDDTTSENQSRALRDEVSEAVSESNSAFLRSAVQKGLAAAKTRARRKASEKAAKSPREAPVAATPIKTSDESDLYTLSDALDAIQRYQLEQIVVLPVFHEFGCADLALEISRSIANNGQSVVFVDTTSGDLDETTLLTGISDVMSGQAELDEAIFADPMSPVDLMASGTSELNPMDWHEGRTQAMLDALAEKYAITVLHAGDGTSVPYLNELIERSDMLLFATGQSLSRRQVADILKEKIGDVPPHSMFVYFEDDGDVESAA